MVGVGLSSGGGGGGEVAKQWRSAAFGRGKRQLRRREAVGDAVVV